jgi:hypothetical protein
MPRPLYPGEKAAETLHMALVDHTTALDGVEKEN